jgi:hypothetical protein
MGLDTCQVHSEWEEEDEAPGVEAALRFELRGGSDGASAAHGGSAHGLLLRDLFDNLGETPLPPYIRRSARADDRDRYQSVYADQAQLGSVAAPTAGLHLTPEVLDSLAANAVRRSNVALHVSAGTFRPVVAERVSDHSMHSERFSVCVGGHFESAARRRWTEWLGEVDGVARRGGLMARHVSGACMSSTA